MNDNPNGRFYRDGLRFSCSRCNLCCRFESGYVWLSRADLVRLAEGLEMTSEAVIDRFCRVVDIGGFKQLSLREQQNNDCVFWRDGGCTVYGFRPVQCRSYPFWAHQLADRQAWDRVEQDCPGVNVGRLHSEGEIDELLERRRLEPPLNADSIER
ncbi:MAG: YkgJ family cysteine cluster protein [Spirochaetota bacterium]